MKKEGIQGVKKEERKRGWEGRKEEEGRNKRGEKSKQKSNMCQEHRNKNNVWVKSSKRKLG